MSEQLKKAIQMLGEDVPEANVEKKQALIEQSKQLIQHAPPKRMSLRQFYFQQWQFIRPRTWAIQFLLVVLAAMLILNAPNTQAIIAIASTVSPFIFLVSFSEVIRSHTHRMYELEMATAFSYKAVMLARISLMNILNMFAVTLLIFTVVQTGQLAILQAFFFICIPFLLTSSLGLWLFMHTNRENVNQIVYSAGAVFSVSLMLLLTRYPELFLSISTVIWWGVFFMTLGVVLYQYNRFIRMISVRTEPLQV